ncbi:ParB N-terminal domain-containing protein [Streptomyces violascens]|uniref:transcriptional regulator n=1 Tax=Streptomyces violascens TaxID=67381 RepID=UPI0036A33975
MSKDFGRPPQAEENQELVRLRLAEANGTAGPRETLTVEWRGAPLHVEVIDMPVASLYYNPGTHRIRAQRSYDPAQNSQLEADPWSSASQDYLQQLLRALPADPAREDPDYHVLRDSLQSFKQTDPGLITRDGVLVNGNTRRAALAELGVANIRVGVLPESCTWADVDAVELSLQLRRDHRREYSYVNRLLAIEEQFSLGRQPADIAREFRIRTATCEQDLWILTCLRDLIERSRDGDAVLRLLDFEDHQEKLKELHRRYVKESAVSKENADLLKETRLTAILLGFSKTDVRLIEPDFKARYLDKRLPQELKSAETPAAVAIPGLGRTVRAADPKVGAAQALTNSILKAKAVEGAAEVVAVHRLTAASSTFQSARAAVESALEPAGKDARVRKRKQAAPDRISDACQDLEQGITDLVMSRASRSLDEEVLDEAVVKLRDTLGRLAAECARSVSEPGEGVAWLLDAMRQKD